LVLRRFEEAVQICCVALDQKFEENGDEPSYRIQEKKTPFVVIAVQAYAENNQYQRAVEFSRRVFGNAAKFPPVVLELCIYLLVKASEYRAADELADKWLFCAENFSHQRYLEIVEFYVKQVLFPQGMHGKIHQFLETNKALTSEQKQSMLVSIQESSRKCNEKLGHCSSPVDSDSREVAVQHKPKQKQGGHSAVVRRMLAVMKNLQRLCRNYVPCSRWQKSVTILRVLILLFFIYALILAASGHLSVTPGPSLLIFWQTVVNSWRAMFSPYHMM